MRILFFAESLTCGGKERRLLELIKYLKQHTDYTLALVLAENTIHYKYVYELGIPITIIDRKYTKYDPLPFLKFYKYCNLFKPDIIHTWGIMTTFYAIPAKLLRRTPLISSMIANAKNTNGAVSMFSLYFSINTLFSNVILSNSQAGLTAYKVNIPKSKVILNGVHPERFQQQFDKQKVRQEFGIKTNFVIIMVASFTNTKDYDLFLDVAKEVGKIRKDVTFIGVGDGPKLKHIQDRMNIEQISNVILTGSQKEVERIIAASDIGLLCTYCEGVSNSIIEYMALEKPVIATDLVGGSKEIVVEGETGYCTIRSSKVVVSLINKLLEDEELRHSMGIKGKARIASHFSISRMGKDFQLVYEEFFSNKKGDLELN
jgi:glycosyltransferase involved in cell wall biosynthesis